MAYELPALPYDYDALEPQIDARTMEIHHTKHHQAYITKVNEALAGSELAGKPIEEVISNLAAVPEAKRGAVPQQWRRPCQPFVCSGRFSAHQAAVPTGNWPRPSRADLGGLQFLQGRIFDGGGDSIRQRLGLVESSTVANWSLKARPTRTPH